jgi:hypothetical protein
MFADSITLQNKTASKYSTDWDVSYLPRVCQKEEVVVDIIPAGAVVGIKSLRRTVIRDYAIAQARARIR